MAQKTGFSVFSKSFPILDSLKKLREVGKHYKMHIYKMHHTPLASYINCRASFFLVLNLSHQYKILIIKHTERDSVCTQVLISVFPLERSTCAYLFNAENTNGIQCRKNIYAKYDFKSVSLKVT